MNDFLNKFIKGDRRQAAIKLNIILSGILRGLTMISSFAIIRVTIGYLAPEKFGVWMTILTITGWISNFDVGLSNGLRNKLTEAIAIGDNKKAKIYVSSSYFIFSIVILFLIIIFCIGSNFINYSKLFNVNAGMENEIKSTFICVVVLYLLTFYCSLINAVALAKQHSFILELKNLISNVSIIIACVILTITVSSNLFNFGLAYSLCTLIAAAMINFILFSGKYRDVRPSLKFIDLKEFKFLFSLGFGFFILQITYLIIFTTDNMLITQLLGPTHVTVYQVTYKYFSVITTVFNLITIPLWSAFTDAYVKKDFSFINKTLRKMIKIVQLTILISVIFAVAAKFIIKLWVGVNLQIPNILIILMTIYIVQACWNALFSCFVNGIGRIKLQLITAVIGGVINIPLSIYFVKSAGMGVSGIILATIISLLPSSILIPIETFGILKNQNNKKAELIEGNLKEYKNELDNV